ETVAIWLSTIVNSILGTLIFFFVLVLLQALLKNRWLVAVVFVALFTAPKILAANQPYIELPIWLTIYAIAAVAVVRFGLVVLGTATFMANVILNTPFTLDFSKWYASNFALILLSFVVLSVWGFYHSLGGQKLWKADMFE